METSKTMTPETQAEAQSTALATALAPALAASEPGGQNQHISFAGALLGFMITTTLTTSIMVLLSQG
jgi:hypothetical protein